MYKITVVEIGADKNIWKRFNDKEELDKEKDPHFGYEVQTVIYEQIVSDINLRGVIEAVNNLK